MTQTKKASEGDVVELLEDLPKYDVLRGQRGVVINDFNEPNEAYDLALEDSNGEFIAFAYSVNPTQFRNITRDLFEQGINLINKGKMEEAKAPFREAIDLKPSLIGVLHNSMLNSFAESTDYGRIITGLNFVLDLNPTYEVAQTNLAIAFRKYGIQAAEEGDMEQADTYFQMALFVSVNPDNIHAVHQDYSALLTSEGLRAFINNNPEFAFQCMRQAFLFAPDEITKSNFGKSMIFLARKHAEEKRYESAIELYRWAIKIIGLETPDLLNEFGICLGVEGRFDEAVMIFSRARELAPHDQTILQNLSLAKLKHKVIQSFASEGANLTFEIPQPSKSAEFQKEYLPPQTPQYTLLAA